MKLSRKKKTACDCALVAFDFLLGILQVIFITMKLSGQVDWSWWRTLTPIFVHIGFPIAVVLIATIVMIPKAVAESIRRRKRVEAEAKKYGMTRKPGESDAELKKRIIHRNMIDGNYTRKNLKDAILETFPTVGSCPIFVNNQTKEITLTPRCVDFNSGSDCFTDDELREIAEFAAQHIPSNYKITVKNNKECSKC